ncbi:MAG TPA: hypothetical protein VFN75_02525 [Pseudonocardiaceae bacterium]|nr:hypothetical protein [Pseudonocardiaceae bacterium]
MRSHYHTTPSPPLCPAWSTGMSVDDLVHAAAEVRAPANAALLDDFVVQAASR